MLFCAQHVVERHAFSTIKTYLAGINFFNAKLGYTTHFDCNALRDLKFALKRTLGVAPKRKRLPITIEILLAFHSLLDLRRYNDSVV